MVRSVAATVYGRSVELARIGRPPAPRQNEARPWLDVLGIAFRDYRKRTVMLLIFQVLQTVAYYGLGTLAPLVLVAKGFDLTESLVYASLSFVGYPPKARRILCSAVAESTVPASS